MVGRKQGLPAFSVTGRGNLTPSTLEMTFAFSISVLEEGIEWPVSFDLTVGHLIFIKYFWLE